MGRAGKNLNRQKVISRRKARKILSHGEVHGHPLTEKQEGFFGARAAGLPIKRK